mmetsp:Transcript_14640/g.32302  ORF Transcript_14640/g.32302 Transcript_14640/m.32302 type:complete len:421 (-) Transcript_14640:130-1392(-)
MEMCLRDVMVFDSERDETMRLQAALRRDLGPLFAKDALDGGSDDFVHGVDFPLFQIMVLFWGGGFVPSSMLHGKRGSQDGQVLVGGASNQDIFGHFEVFPSLGVVTQQDPPLHPSRSEELWGLVQQRCGYGDDGRHVLLLSETPDSGVGRTHQEGRDAGHEPSSVATGSAAIPQLGQTEQGLPCRGGQVGEEEGPEGLHDDVGVVGAVDEGRSGCDQAGVDGGHAFQALQLVAHQGLDDEGGGEGGGGVVVEDAGVGRDRFGSGRGGGRDGRGGGGGRGRLRFLRFGFVGSGRGVHSRVRFLQLQQLLLEQSPRRLPVLGGDRVKKLNFPPQPRMMVGDVVGQGGTVARAGRGGGVRAPGLRRAVAELLLALLVLVAAGQVLVGNAIVRDRLGHVSHVSLRLLLHGEVDPLPARDALALL